MIYMELVTRPNEELWLWRLKHAYIYRIFHGIQSYATIKMWLSSQRIDWKKKHFDKNQNNTLSNITAAYLTSHNPKRGFMF